MERTNKKECPKCGDENVHDTGDRAADAQNLEPGRPIRELYHPVFECNNCGERFVII